MSASQPLGLLVAGLKRQKLLYRIIRNTIKYATCKQYKHPYSPHPFQSRESHLFLCVPDQMIRLNVGNNTVILDENNNRILLRDLQKGMVVNAAFSNATTRSIPPQSAAYVIQVIGRPLEDQVTVGRIVDIDRQNRSFTTISDGNISSVIRFHLADDAKIFNSFGRPMQFASLVPGLRVRVRHAAFMTMSIPPQTTAFEVRVITV